MSCISWGNLTIRLSLCYVPYAGSCEEMQRQMNILGDTALNALNSLVGT